MFNNKHEKKGFVVILAAKSHSLRQFGKMVKLKEFLKDSASAYNRDYCSMIIRCRIFR